MTGFKRFLNLLKTSRGQGLVEYGFILLLIALALFTAIGSLGQHLLNFFINLPSRFPA